MNQEQLRGARITRMRLIANEGGSITVQAHAIVPALERRQQPACMSAEPMTADEITKLFDDYVERCGGAHGSAQERAFTAATPALAAQRARVERRDRRWRLATALVALAACAAAIYCRGLPL